MKKTLTVNLGGTVFNIDDDAYRLLDNYLSNLKMHFRKEAGADEIVDDQPTELDEESDSDELSPESEDYEDIIATAEQQAFSEGNVSENVTSDIPSIVEPKV